MRSPGSNKSDLPESGSLTADGVKKRRRGADLEQAILEEAWAAIAEHGYAGVTMEEVAARAGTSRTVLARRWDGKAALTVAAIRQQLTRHPVQVVECGDLRTELLEWLDHSSKRVPMLTVVFAMLSSAYFRDSATSPLDLRNALSEGENSVPAAIFRRAVERGEIDARKLIPCIRTLLQDLLRHHAMMALAAPAPSLRETWVDAIFLPLVRPGHAGRTPDHNPSSPKPG